MSFTALDHLNRKLEALSHAQSMLGVDEAVNMPAGGGEARGSTMSTLAGMMHEMASSPEVGDLLSKAESETLSAEQRAAIAQAKIDYINRTCLSSDFVKRRVATGMRSEQAWRTMRAKGDWKNYLPIFSDVIALVREEAAIRADALKLSPYDAMMEQYDPGNRTAWITPVFTDLKAFLKDFLPEALSVQKAKPKPKALKGPFPIPAQKALGETLMRAIGFDFHHGRLDVSHHPFCGGVPSDVRMTTRYRDAEFLSSLMGILHETGHGLYEQGLPKQWSHWSIGAARGMGVHESQSLFTEMQLSRRESFWTFALPHARKAFGKSLTGWKVADILRHVHKVERGLIRVEADEVTYPLHVIMRYELEQDLVTGALMPKDVPDAFNAKMKSYIGLKSSNAMKDGPLQDVHWTAGAVGYFPSYTLGAMMAAQQWSALAKKHPRIDQDIAKGKFDKITKWRAENIWSKASFRSTPELMREATGEPLNAKYFIEHLKSRYGN
jgi:carboxypeptidase Taq